MSSSLHKKPICLWHYNCLYSNLGPSINRLVTAIYWKYVVEAELSKLTYVED